MKHILITTIAAVVLLATTAFAGPIHTAAKKGDLARVQKELDKGTDVNAKNNNGDTPLLRALLFGHEEVAALLIAAGADVNAKDKYGKTPLYLAIENKQTEIADIIRKHGGKTGDWLNADKSIHIATRAGHIEAVKQHLAAGVDANAKDEWGWTPLHEAATKDVAELLIAEGADVNAKDDEG